MCRSVFLKETECPVCGSNHRHLLGYPLKVDARFGPFEDALREVAVARCRSCNLLYLHPEVEYSEEFLKDLYPLDYWGDDRDKDAKNLKDKRALLDEAVRLRNIDPRGSTLVDIGCGMGEFLRLAAERGIEPLGIDLNRSATDYVTRTFGHRVINGPLTNQTLPESSFDFVVLSHVIEHVQQPAGLLSIVHKVLRPGGVLLTATPNVASFMSALIEVVQRARFGSRYSFMLSPFSNPYHVLGFDEESSRVLHESAGFTIRYNRARPTLSWKIHRFRFAFTAIKLLGAVLGRGEQLVTIAQKLSGCGPRPVQNP